MMFEWHVNWHDNCGKDAKLWKCLTADNVIA